MVYNDTTTIPRFDRAIFLREGATFTVGKTWQGCTVIGFGQENELFEDTAALIEGLRLDSQNRFSVFCECFKLSGGSVEIGYRNVCRLLPLDCPQAIILLRDLKDAMDSVARDPASHPPKYIQVKRVHCVPVQSA